MARRRVVVTGLGIVAPVGIGVTESWASIVAGKSGISRITRFDAAAFSSQIAGEVRGFDVSRYLPSKEARRMDTFIHYGMAAGIEAIVLSPVMGDCNEDLRLLGVDALRAGIRVQLAPEDVARFMTLAA